MAAPSNNYSEDDREKRSVAPQYRHIAGHTPPGMFSNPFLSNERSGQNGAHANGHSVSPLYRDERYAQSPTTDTSPSLRMTLLERFDIHKKEMAEAEAQHRSSSVPRRRGGHAHDGGLASRSPSAAPSSVAMGAPDSPRRSRSATRSRSGIKVEDRLLAEGENMRFRKEQLSKQYAEMATNVGRENIKVNLRKKSNRREFNEVIERFAKKSSIHEEWLAKERQIRESKEVEGISFTPRLNKTSIRMAKQKPSLVERTALEQANLKQYLESEREKQLLEEKALCRQPAITPSAARMTRSIDTILAWEEQRRETLRRKKEDLELEEMKEAPFTPNICPRSEKIFNTRKRDSNSTERLWEHSVQHQKLLASLAEESAAPEPPHVPQINERSRRLARDGDIGERLYGSAVKRRVQQQLNLAVQKSAEKDQKQKSLADMKTPRSSRKQSANDTMNSSRSSRDHEQSPRPIGTISTTTPGRKNPLKPGNARNVVSFEEFMQLQKKLLG